MKSNDQIILQKMIQYVDEINETFARFSLSCETFSLDTVAKNAISMCILQIGELAGRLTEEFKQTYDGMPWQQIKSMRNIAAHNYGEIDMDILWEVASDEVLKLKEYCKEILKSIES